MHNTEEKIKEMTSEALVCKACAQNCRLFHGTAKTSPISFFKVMSSKDCLRILQIPPVFKETLSAMVNKKVILKDCQSQQWTVTVSNSNGSLAFDEGWSYFSLDHGLKVGDLLIFNYINKLLIDVMIYDESACQKLDFSKKKNKRKRSRGRSGSPVRDDMLVRQSPISRVVSKPDMPEMTSQHNKADLGGTQICKESISKHVNNNESVQFLCISEHCDGTMKIATMDCETHIYQSVATPCNKDLVFGGILGSGAASYISELEMSGGNNSLRETGKRKYEHTSTLKLEVNKEIKCIVSNREDQECQLAKGLESDQVVFSINEPMFNGSSNDIDAHIHSGKTKNLPMDLTPKSTDKSHAAESEQAVILKKEPMFDGSSNFLNACVHSGEMKNMPAELTPEFTNKLHATDEMPETSKKELVTLNVCSYNDELVATGLAENNNEENEFGHSSHTMNQDSENHIETAATVSCVVPADIDCLKLPMGLPSSRKGKVRMDRMLVLLRHPQTGELWPVLYHEQLSLKILTHGWFSFCSANNIQPEDECTFAVEDESERIFSIHIVHK